MYTNKVKRIAPINNLSGFRFSIFLVVIANFSSMSYSGFPLPTAVFCSHTQYAEFSIS